jgi:transposase
MPHKYKYSEEQTKYIIDLFEDTSIVNKEKKIPELFHLKFNFSYNISYKTLKRHYISQIETPISTPNVVFLEFLRPGVSKIYNESNTSEYGKSRIKQRWIDSFLKECFTNNPDTLCDYLQEFNIFLTEFDLTEKYIEYNGF